MGKKTGSQRKPLDSSPPPLRYLQKNGAYIPYGEIDGSILRSIWKMLHTCRPCSIFPHWESISICGFRFGSQSCLGVLLTACLLVPYQDTIVNAHVISRHHCIICINTSFWGVSKPHHSNHVVFLWFYVYIFVSSLYRISSCWGRTFFFRVVLKYFLHLIE